jgi:hypothetical protein
MDQAADGAQEAAEAVYNGAQQGAQLVSGVASDAYNSQAAADGKRIAAQGGAVAAEGVQIAFAEGKNVADDFADFAAPAADFVVGVGRAGLAQLPHGIPQDAMDAARYV